MASVNMKGGVFSFTRDHNGEGFWYCVAGKDPTSLGGVSSINLAVAAEFACEVTARAIELGLGTAEDFAKIVESPKYAAVHIPKEPKIKNGMIKFAFNPFKKVAKETVE